jgi:hypothetical protein
MTNQHPITPPPELVQQWADMLSSLSDHAVFSLAAQWGWDQREPEIQAAADQELEACAKWVRSMFGELPAWADELRTARRPKPPSLKERIAAAITEGDERTALLLLNEALPND